MAVQELTQPILNPIAAFDATVEHTISFVAIGGAQVLGNRLVISNNQTGAVVYNQMQTTMRLEHVIPANTLQNGGYYNAVVYTVSSGGEESVASTAVPFYCYSRPTLTINNIPATETIENGTYTFTASYSQAENELLDSYQFTLYDSNRNILSQSNLIYYQTDSSLSYTFVGMSNDTAYYIGITGETVNGTQITSGLVYFTVRYSQPASFAICDLVNDCENGYIQISSNIVAIDGKSNPDPPIYIDDKEVDLREPGSWVEWDEGFDIQNDFTMRVWGRDFNEYENIITLMNDENTDSNPNRIELKWMVGDVLKNLPEYSSVNGYNINIENAEATTIENLRIAGNSIQQTNSGEQIVAGNGFVNFNTVAEKPINIEIEGTQEQETREGYNLLQNKLTDTTINGVTFKINEDKSVTVNGTATASIIANLITGEYNDNNATEPLIIPDNITNCRLSGCPSGGSSSTYKLDIYNQNYALLATDWGEGTNVTIDSQEDKKIARVRIIIYSGATVNNLTFKPMLVAGTEEKPYEPYGVMPSPEYPSEIKCLGSNKNEFNDSNVYNGYILVKVGGKVGYKSSALSITYKKCCKLTENVNYMLSFNKNNPVATAAKSCAIVDEDENVLQVFNLNPAEETMIITPTNTGYLYLVMDINATNIKIEEGTEATSYSPYGQGSTLISKINKNFLNLNNLEVANNNGIDTYSIDNPNQITLKNKATTSGIPYSYAFQAFHLNLPQGDYNLSAKTKTNSTNYRIIIRGKRDGSNTTAVEVLSQNKNNGNFNIDYSQCDEYAIEFYANQSYVEQLVTTTYYDIQIQKGNIATDYIEHQQKDYILPIQQEMLKGDYFIKEADSWKEVHNWNKLILTGDESYNNSVGYINIGRFGIYPSLPANPGSLANPNALSNYYKPEFVVADGNIFVSGVDGCVYMINEAFKGNLDGFKEQLNSYYQENKPVYIYYGLKTPTKLSCTEEQNTILNELSNNMSFVGENNIYTSGDLPIPIKVSDIATPTPSNPSDIYSVGEVRNLIDVADFNIAYNQQYFQATNTNFVLKSNFIYTLSFNYEVNSTTTDLYYTLGYGTDNYVGDITGTNQYTSLTSGRNSITFVVPDDIPANSILWVKFGQTIILADIDVNISNIQLEEGSILHNYEEPELYNIYPTISAKNIYNENSILYLKKENITYSVIQNGYNIVPATVGEEAYFGIGWRNILNAGDTYAIGYSSLGNLTGFNLYMVDKNGQGVIDEIEVNNGVFTAPEGVYDLQLTFGIDSSVSTNYVEIWNIQIEANNTVSQFETYTSNGSIISTDTPLRGIDNYRDLIALESPNLLNQATQSGNVVGGETYYLNQSGDTTYYIWYYNIAGNLITFLDPEGQETSGVSGIRGSFTVHDECVRITMTKSANPEANDLTSDEILSNEVSITRGSTAQSYYPYITQPSKIVNVGTITFNGTESWRMPATNEQNAVFANLANTNIYDFSSDNDTQLSNYFIWGGRKSGYQRALDSGVGMYTNDDGHKYVYFVVPLSIASTVEEWTTWLQTINSSGKPLTNYYKLSNPAIYPLPDDNISALSGLSTYNPISNVYTNNQVLGNISLDYVTGYSEQQTQNAYVQLKCYNSNNMPYFVHSNYIDIPEDISTVFIWCRRRNNLFDLQIEDLGDYDGGEQPEDTNPPVVTLDIDLEEVTSSTIPVTAQSIDDVGLRTVRFSKDNGQTWDEVVPVDGLSSTNSYTFTGLSANTLYTIRVEAIDLSGNIGGMSQQVTTHVS